MPTNEARAISLKNHLALVTTRAGHGNTDLMSCLLRVVYIACFLHEADHGRIALDLFREAEKALTQCIQRAERTEEWSLCDADCEILQEILALHDQQLASTSSHRVAAAHARLCRFMASGQLSPIAAAQML